MDFLTLTIGKQKNIALIAHDSKKHEMIDWCEANKEILKGQNANKLKEHRRAADDADPRFPALSWLLEDDEPGRSGHEDSSPERHEADVRSGQK